MKNISGIKFSTYAIIFGLVIVLVLGISIVGILSNEVNLDIANTLTLSDHVSSEGITSGPLYLTKPQYKINERIFYIISGLKDDEKGNIRFFTPDGRLYITRSYDGAEKPFFNQYFKPDTSYLTGFCELDEFVGEWTIRFDKNAYPPLRFEILDESLSGPNYDLKKAC